MTLEVGELVGERSFWGLGNRGKSSALVAETAVEVQWLEFEVRTDARSPQAGLEAVGRSEREGCQ